MTWAVAIPGVEVAAVVADTQITHSKSGHPDIHQTRFGVLKVHQIAPYGFAAFAGHIESGFAAIEALRFVTERQFQQTTSGMYVDRVADDFAFTHEASPRFADVEIVMVISDGLEPQMTDTGMHISSMMRIPAVRLRIDKYGKLFAKDRSGWPSDTLSIGSGYEIQAIKDTFQRFTGDPNFLVGEDPMFYDVILHNMVTSAVRSAAQTSDPSVAEVNDLVVHGIVTDPPRELVFLLDDEQKGREVPIARDVFEFREMNHKWGPTEGDFRASA